MAVINDYDVGEQVDVTATFTEPSTGLPVDPEVVTFKYKGPDGVINLVTLASMRHVAGTGVYIASYVVTASGAWYERFESTNPKGARERRINVRPSEF